MAHCADDEYSGRMHYASIVARVGMQALGMSGLIAVASLWTRRPGAIGMCHHPFGASMNRLASCVATEWNPGQL
jgi:hypothetical protein